MKILVIGGSYFLGRWFVELARRENTLTVMNRGSIPLNIEGVTELKGDRHDIDFLENSSCRDYDCIVDFCAYMPGDITGIIQHFSAPGTRYIFISTVDVYKKGTSLPLNEESAFEDSFSSDETGDYIKNKILLENELTEAASEYGIIPVSVRPGILYGPANYAPRESLYFNWIVNSRQILSPSDATGSFQFIYVADAAKGILKLCSIESSLLKNSYNFCTDSDTYDSFEAALLQAVPVAFEPVGISVSEITQRNIPLPFPLAISETEVYSHERFTELGIALTPLSEGLSKAFKSLYPDLP